MSCDDQGGEAMNKAYEKPELAKIKLAAEDAVLTACKAIPPTPGVTDKCLNGNIVDNLFLGS